MNVSVIGAGNIGATLARGGLDQSWRQQPGTPAYTADLDAPALASALAHARPEDTPQWRARVADWRAAS